MKINQLTHSLPAKITAFFLLAVVTCLVFSCAFGAIFMAEEEFYVKDSQQLKDECFRDMSRRDGLLVLGHLLDMNKDFISTFHENSNFSFTVQDSSGKEIGGNFTPKSVNSNDSSTEIHYNFTYEKEELRHDFSQLFNAANPYSPNIDDQYTVYVYIDDSFPTNDKYAVADKAIDFAYPLRYWVIAIGILSAIAALLLFIFLICSAGHKRGHEEITAGGLTKIPLDLLTAALLLAAFVTLSLFYDSLYGSTFVIFLSVGIGILLAVLIGTAYCMNLAVRFKLGGWWKNTIIYHLLVLAPRMCKKLGHGFVALSQGLLVLMQALPLVWKVLVSLLVLSAMELFVLLAFSWRPEMLLTFWFIEKVVLVPTILYIAIILRKLQKGGEMLAKGDLSYQIDTKHMFFDFQKHGENLNSIAEGMTHAVDERMKSERFKTELITNVSHDIKTPLTSIINYAELISKEPSENAHIEEYAQVLLRQSHRLKKLLEDLVEASKASTGSVDVLLAPCEVGVLLTQTAGEYAQHLQDSDLQLITKQPESPVKIMADGRLLWRIFDNLMNNICKYSQAGTRVYLNVEERNGEAIISFKNTSSYPLDITADELMERFIRGDHSRSTEGSGLGLSIARGFTDLQKGRLELIVDGDLFKVILVFKAIK